MSDDPMPYDGDPCGCVMCAEEDATLFFKGEAFCLACWQAAELTRLRARIEAADRLAEAADAHLDALNDYLKTIGCGDTGAAKAMASLVAERVLRAALSAYGEVGK